METASAGGAVRPDPLPGRELSAFVAAVESGSVQSAADQLSLTQSAATKRIQALERRLGLRLLVRGRFGVRVTEAGEALLPEAKFVLAALSRAEASIEHLRTGPQHLHLAASHTIGGYLLPRWLATFRATMPRAQARLEVVNSPAVLAAVIAGDVDIGFIEGPEKVGRLAEMTILDDEVRVMVAADHPWAGREAVELGELATEAYVAREQGSGTRSFAHRALRAHGVTLIPEFEAGSIETIKRAIATGEGFALMSMLTVEQEVEAGTLAAVSLRGVRIDRSLRAVKRRGDVQHAVAHRFWSWLRRLGASRPAAARHSRGPTGRPAPRPAPASPGSRP